MTVDVSVQMDGLDRLVADLGKAGRRTTLEAAKVLTKAAVKVKDGMRQDFTGHNHAPRIPGAISYTVLGLSFEVGVDKNGPQGALGNLLAFGSSKNAAVVDHTAALRRELPAIEKFLASAAEDALT